MPITGFMLPSVEVRWFGAGEAPGDVREWFLARGGDAAPAPTRTDYYLRVVEGDGMGIKLREGRFEAKQRERRFGVVEFGDGVAGQVESWRKWSYLLDDPRAGSADGEGASPFWVAVTKERSQKFCSLDGADKVRHAAPGELLDLGCALELTRVTVNDEPWWTVGLEAFGDETRLPEALTLVAQRLSAAANAPRLAAEDSYGYPKWLKVL